MVPLAERGEDKMTLHVFMVMLLACSLLTTLTVEGIKNMTKDIPMRFGNNIVAAGVAIILALAISCGYNAYMAFAFDAKFWIAVCGLVFLSWLCAMVGYDKVIQALAQLGKE